MTADESKTPEERAEEIYEGWRLSCHLDTWLAPDDRTALQTAIAAAIRAERAPRREISESEIEEAADDVYEKYSEQFRDTCKEAFRRGARWALKKINNKETEK